MSATLLTYLTDAETGQRGFLLTSKSAYLDPHYTGVIKSRDLLAQLKEKNFEHPIQLERLANIESLVDAKFVELQQTIDLHRIGKKEEALDIVMSDLGQALMDEMRRELEAFKLEEEQLLFERRTRFTSIRNTIQTIFIIEVSVFTLVLIFLGIVVSQTILKPLSMLQETAKTFKETGYFEPVDIKSKDEIGSLAQALNTMGQKVTELLVDLDSTAIQAMIERDIAIEQAISDPLTGLSNRRFMEVELESLMLSSHRYEHALSIILKKAVALPKLFSLSKIQWRCVIFLKCSK
jgi:CHASE3 domain sensor protein